MVKGGSSASYNVDPLSYLQLLGLRSCDASCMSIEEIQYVFKCYAFRIILSEVSKYIAISRFLIFIISAVSTSAELARRILAARCDALSNGAILSFSRITITEKSLIEILASIPFC